jgi:hypothetical protein
MSVHCPSAATSAGNGRSTAFEYRECPDDPEPPSWGTALARRVDTRYPVVSTLVRLGVVKFTKPPLDFVFPRYRRARLSAASVVESARIIAACSYGGVMRVCPELSRASLQDWTFSLTVASICSALALLEARGGEQLSRRIAPLILTDVRKWSASGERAVNECREWLVRNADAVSHAHSPISHADALGNWVVWNCLQHSPPPDSSRLIEAAGALAASPFLDYWT